MNKIKKIFGWESVDKFLFYYCSIIAVGLLSFFSVMLVDRNYSVEKYLGVGTVTDKFHNEEKFYNYPTRDFDGNWKTQTAVLPETWYFEVWVKTDLTSTATLKIEVEPHSWYSTPIGSKVQVYHREGEIFSYGYRVVNDSDSNR